MILVILSKFILKISNLEELVAIKKIYGNMKSLSQGKTNPALREISCMNKLKHKNVCNNYK